MKRIYESPTITVVEVVIECGIAVTGGKNGGFGMPDGSDQGGELWRP